MCCYNKLVLVFGYLPKENLFFFCLWCAVFLLVEEFMSLNGNTAVWEANDLARKFEKWEVVMDKAWGGSWLSIWIRARL